MKQRGSSKKAFERQEKAKIGKVRTFLNKQKFNNQSLLKRTFYTFNLMEDAGRPNRNLATKQKEPFTKRLRAASIRLIVSGCYRTSLWCSSVRSTPYGKEVNGGEWK